MEGSAAVAYHGSMGGMPISRSRNEQVAFFTTNQPALMCSGDHVRSSVAVPTGGVGGNWEKKFLITTQRNMQAQRLEKQFSGVGGGAKIRRGGLYESTHTKNMEI